LYERVESQQALALVLIFRRIFSTPIGQLTARSGTGKTHIALGLVLAACQRGLKVRFIKAAALVHDLIEAQDERGLQRLQKQLTSQNLLIIDELGFVPLSKSARNCSLRSYPKVTNGDPSP